MSLISQFDLINKKHFFLLILQCININYSLCMTDTIYQFTARNVYKTIFNLKDLIDKKNTINLTSLTTRTAEGERMKTTNI